MGNRWETFVAPRGEAVPHDNSGSCQKVRSYSTVQQERSPGVGSKVPDTTLPRTGHDSYPVALGLEMGIIIIEQS